MTAYTVILQTAAPARPVQQPGSYPKVAQGDGNPSSSPPTNGLTNQIMEDQSYGFNVQNVNAASKSAALTAAIAAYQTAWAVTENARYTGTQSQEDLPGGVPVYLATQAPLVRNSIVLTGTATFP